MTSPTRSAPRHAEPPRPLRIAVLGAPVVAAGSVVEEIGRRLVEQGHGVTVYSPAGARKAPTQHLGMRLVPVPALHVGPFEPLSRTALSTAYASFAPKPDVAFVFDVANAGVVTALRARGTAVAVHVVGLEPKRGRGGPLELRYRRRAEALAVRSADALIADARSVARYYDDEFGVPTEPIGYGARILHNTPSDVIETLGLVPGWFHLAVAAGDRDDHLEVVVEGYTRSAARSPLVVVGPGPGAVLPRRVTMAAARDSRIRLLGGVRDERLLDQLHAHAIGFLHGRAPLGTDRSLLRAMGAGTAPVAWDVPSNREVAGTAGLYFRSSAQLAGLIEEVERYPFRFTEIGELMRERAHTRYSWNEVGEAYELLAKRLARGYSTRGLSAGRRRPALPVPVTAREMLRA
ncbi:glycosyltransferase [Amnibacterium sp.]|uniref:glycosyltransferase n=1 Tax=Amnibacterium sp. TaxID=1872496 RepID=UPI00261A951C|nr:glycosyltransferase [Amnibacterium sp.]MCU1473158.1 glycosyl transferase [Amnibacterium sp.]